MTRLGLKARFLASCLSALAGYVDAIGFIALGGFFVSFMSGNSTRLAVGIAQASPNGAIAAGLISAFILGVVLGSIVGRLSAVRRRPFVIGFVSLLLAAGALLNALGHRGATLVLMAIAMGAENAVFEEGGDVKVGLTYMTGALVKMGHAIAGVFFGGNWLAWTPYLLLWSGLLAGAIAGAAVYHELDLSGLWIAAGAGAVLTLVASKTTDEA
jgi:uncharacterized membrane protein YoaK (UPF0700 family)